jgi:hypothetical protein
MSGRVKIISSIICAIAFWSVLDCRADYIEPGTVAVKTVKYAPGLTSLPEGSYEYKISWAALPVARASIEVRSENRDSTDLITISALARSSRLVNLFYSLNHLSETVLVRDTLAPLVYHYIQRENSKLRSVEIAYGESGEIKTKLWKDKDFKLYEERKFSTESYMLDPLSAGYMARLAPGFVGEQYDYDVYNGKHRFLISLKIESKEKIKIAGVEREAFKVVPSVRKLTDSEGEKRLRSATIWVSADDRRDILKLNSEVFFGAITAELIKFTSTVAPALSNVRASLAPPTEDDLLRSIESLTTNP